MIQTFSHFVMWGRMMEFLPTDMTVSRYKVHGSPISFTQIHVRTWSMYRIQNSAKSMFLSLWVSLELRSLWVMIVCINRNKGATGGPMPNYGNALKRVLCLALFTWWVPQQLLPSNCRSWSFRLALVFANAFVTQHERIDSSVEGDW